MTTKSLTSLLTISLCLFFLFSCKTRYINEMIDIENKPYIFYNAEDTSKCIYITLNGQKLNVYVGGVEFIGNNNINLYLDSAYYNNPLYNGNEYNIIEHFSVLFDKDLNIVEIRISHRQFANNRRFYYDNVLMEAIKKTKSQWRKTVDGKKWYVCFFSYRVI